ncbi:MAG: PIG-L family deacetylase, partial [Chloroflexota bacterium]|nr:PIG-L family deacetylase [Chloroflexota bacterium]
MKVLVIAPHPDDEVLGAGGTIAKWASQGWEVHIHVLTEGSSSQYPGQPEIVTRKREEAQRAAAVLGAKGLSFADLPDMQLDRIAHVDLNRAIQRCLAETNPQVVLTPYPDVNKDHCLTFESTLVAVRPLAGCGVKEVLAYPVA